MCKLLVIILAFYENYGLLAALTEGKARGKGRDGIFYPPCMDGCKRKCRRRTIFVAVNGNGRIRCGERNSHITREVLQIMSGLGRLVLSGGTKFVVDNDVGVLVVY